MILPPLLSMMVTQARSPRVPTVAETRDLAVFIRTENPPSLLPGDGIGVGGSKWKKAFSHPDALNKSRAGFTNMWHDCTSLIGLSNIFKLDVKELDSSFRPTRAAQKTTSAGSKYMAIKPTQGYRSSTQPRSISHATGTRVETAQMVGNRSETAKNAGHSRRRQSREYIERADSCVESNKEVARSIPDNYTLKKGQTSENWFEPDRFANSLWNSKGRNSFSARGWDIFDTGFAENQTQPLPSVESTQAHPRAGSVPYTGNPQVPIDQMRPNSSPQDSSRVQTPSKSVTDNSLPYNNVKQGLQTTAKTRSGAPGSQLPRTGLRPCRSSSSAPIAANFGTVNKTREQVEESAVSLPTPYKAERRKSPRANGYSPPSSRESTPSHAIRDSSIRQSPDYSVEKQTSSLKANPPTRPRRSGTSKSEKGGRPITTTISSRPRALSAQLNGSKPPDSPMEPVPPIPPPQMEVKQDLLLEALPPLNVPEAAVEEIFTESREHMRKLKMQRSLLDTPAMLKQDDDARTISDEISNLSRLERENARLRAILYMYVVDS